MNIFPSSKKHDLHPLDEFKSYLKHVYAHKTNATYFEEPLLRHYQPFNLFLYFVYVHDPKNPFDRSYESLSSREKEEFISLRLHNYKPGRKSKLDLSEMNKSGNIYIEGAPGVGKSAFAWKMCQNWASGELLQDWSIVILINLCNQHVREARILSQFLFYPDPRVTTQICQDLENFKERVLFIIDGLDQLNEQQLPPKGSVYHQLLNKELLPSATLMIFSKVCCRPRYDAHDQHIQVSCFTNESLDNYIASAFSDDSKLFSDFKSYLSSHPYIHNLMHIPAQCVMITDLYRLHRNHGDTEFSPNTLTELYTDLVRTLLLRYLSTHPEYSLMKLFIHELFDLPEKAKESFMALAHLAARGIEERKYVFDVPKDFETLGSEFTTINFETFGLMQKVDEVYSGMESSESYCFLNLTLQEYLAAYYCSLQNTAERLQKMLLSESPLEHFLSYYCSTSDCPCLHQIVVCHTRLLLSLSSPDCFNIYCRAYKT